MYKPLLLAAALGAAGMLPAPAAAHGHDPSYPRAVSALDLRVILGDGPKVVHHHHHPPRRFFKPRPLKFKHYYAPPRHWHHPRHYRWRDVDHRFEHGRHKGWAHAPAKRAKFKHRHHR